MGLGGLVVMTGAPHMTAEAGMCVLSWSVLGLDGSSEDKNEDMSYNKARKHKSLRRVEV